MSDEPRFDIRLAMKLDGGSTLQLNTVGANTDEALALLRYAADALKTEASAGLGDTQHDR